MGADLEAVLAEARSLGFLGPGAVEDHIGHAEGFAALLGPGEERVMDLGSGGGIPGLVLALRLRETGFVLLESGHRRAAFLIAAVRRLGLTGRVEVVETRAEDAGRSPSLRGAFTAVVARGFGPPAVTAECGAPFLRTGGRLVVSEPPQDVGRWPPVPLVALGLAVGPRSAGERSYQVLWQTSPCPPAYPRRSGMPAKRPLF